MRIEGPESNAARHRYVQRVLGAALWNFEAEIGAVYYGLVYSVDLVAEYKGIFCVGRWHEFVEADAAVHLLEAYYGISVGHQSVDGFGGGGV